MTYMILAINLDTIDLQTLFAAALVVAPLVLFFCLSWLHREMKKRKKYKSQRSVIRYWKFISKQHEYRVH